MLLYVYKEQLDGISLIDVAKDFVAVHDSLTLANSIIITIKK